LPRSLLALGLFAVLGAASSAHAQANSDPRIANSIVGWWSDLQFDNLIKPSTDPIYRQRVAIDDVIVSWMKKSYEPVGGLGTYRRQNVRLTFGVYFMTWSVSYDPQWLDAKGNFKPIPEENTPFAIQANAIPGSYGIKYFNEVSKSSYFTWPADGMTSDERTRKDLALRDAPASKGFITRSNERQTVFLAPNNTLPFVPVTIGEYLDMGDAAYEKQLQNRKAQIDGWWPSESDAHRQSRESAFASVVKEYSAYKLNIQKLREKYRGQLSEPAVVGNMQPTFIGDFSDGPDPFTINVHQRARNQVYPVYKLTPETLALSQTATPQWIAIWYPYETPEDGNQLYELYRTMTEHLNYPYIADYFFNPSKVAGQEYHPLNEAALKQRLAGYGRIVWKK
jgi:hypothetical protein